MAKERNEVEVAVAAAEVEVEVEIGKGHVAGYDWRGSGGRRLGFGERRRGVRPGRR